MFLSPAVRTGYLLSSISFARRVQKVDHAALPASDPKNNRIKHGSPRRSRRCRKKKRLLNLGAGVGVDLQPHRDIDNDERLPLHGQFPRFNSYLGQAKVTSARFQRMATGRLRNSWHTDRFRNCRGGSVRSARLLQDNWVSPRFDPGRDCRDRGARRRARLRR